MQKKQIFFSDFICRHKLTKKKIDNNRLLRKSTSGYASGLTQTSTTVLPNAVNSNNSEFRSQMGPTNVHAIDQSAIQQFMRTYESESFTKRQQASRIVRQIHNSSNCCFKFTDSNNSRSKANFTASMMRQIRETCKTNHTHYHVTKATVESQVGSKLQRPTSASSRTQINSNNLQKRDMTENNWKANSTHDVEYGFQHHQVILPSRVAIDLPQNNTPMIAASSSSSRTTQATISTETPSETMSDSTSGLYSVFISLDYPINSPINSLS